jgi:uncharacterized repeat protein (TIGR03803 family)
MPRSLDIFRKFALGCGLVLAMFGAAHADTVKILYVFKGGADGSYPYAGLISDSQGNLYGTTVEGGGSGCYESQGCGTVFKLARDGTETVLYAFQGGNDGAAPYAGVISDSQGNLYGTTAGGGGSGCNGYGCGTVFKLTPDGAETVLHSFTGGSDGSNPQAGLLLDSGGNLYGTTQYGDAQNAGVVFKVAPNGAESVIYAFCSRRDCADGKQPLSTLIADSAGNLYGTTSYGGYPGGGTVFRIAPDGAEAVLYNFCQVQPECNDGDEPMAGVTRDNAGNLYGTTSWGGMYGSGEVFKLARDGTETVFHSFDRFEGIQPISGVIVDKAGDIYGTLLYSFGWCPLANSETLIRYDHVYRLSQDGSEKLYCVPSMIDAGVIERNGTLYGTGAYSYRYPSGVVFAIKTD